MTKIKTTPAKVYWRRAFAVFSVALFLSLVSTHSAYSESSTISEPVLQGFVDSLVVEGDNLIAQGWVGAMKPKNKVVSISIWLADTLVYEERFEGFERPDVVNATGRSDWLKSGWRINAALPSNLEAGNYLVKVLAKLDNGMEAKLSLQQESVPVSINEYRISRFTKGVFFVLSLLVLLFFTLLAEKLFPASELHKKRIDLPIAPKLKGEEWLYSIFFFVIALAGGKLLLMKFAGATYVNLFAIVFAVISSYVIAHGTCCTNSRSVIQGDNRKSLFLIAGVLFYLGWIYALGVVLPANDPVAVPTFASILNQKTPLYEYYAHGESGATYPPGFPLLLSMTYVFLDHAGVLLLFKILCILAVGLIPFSWSWLAKRVFNIPLPLTTIAIAFYIAGFGIERTLNYALPFAGKNSQLFLLLIFPIFFVHLTNAPRRNWLYVIALGFLFYCLTLFHYSALYVSFALLMATSIIWFLPNPKQSFAIVVRGLFVGLIGAGCFIFFSSEALQDPRRTIGGVYDLGSAFTTFIQIFFGTDTDLLSIFNVSDFQNVGSPMRGYLLIGCLLFSAIVMRKSKNQHNEKSAKPIFLCSGAFFLVIVIAAALGSGLVPAGVNLDFYRWFIFPAQIGVIACALLSAYVLLKSINRKIAISLVTVFLMLPTLVFVTDARKIKKVVDSDAISYSQIQGMHDSLISGPSGCGILSPNFVVIENFTYKQKYRMLEYAEMLTGCRMLAGAWVHAPSVGWRKNDGLPSGDVFNSIPIDMNLYFVGTRSELEKYGKTSSWDEIGLLPREQVPIWKMKAAEK